MADGDSLGHSVVGSPWFKIIERVGVPGALLAFLLWMVFGEFKQVIDANALETINTRAIVETHMRDTDRHQREMLWYMRSICYNMASTREDRDRCIPPRQE